MVYIYTGSSTTNPIGKVSDFNNTNPAKSVALYRLEGNSSVENGRVQTSNNENNFGCAFYGNGPYSLSHPNYKSDILAQNIDFLA